MPRKATSTKQLPHRVPREPETAGETPAIAVGQGELLADSHHQRADARLIRQAIENEWHIKPEVRQLVVGHLALIVGKSRSDRAKIAASMALISADKVNVMRERGEKPIQHEHKHLHAVITPQLTQPERVERLRELIAAAKSRRMGGPVLPAEPAGVSVPA